MTEILDSKKQRQEILKGIISDLHGGKDLEEIKERFARLIRNVSAAEIADMEDQLIAEGLPPEEIKRLCDVHVAVFKESLDRQESPDQVPGHPVHTFRLENQAVGKVVQTLREMFSQLQEGQTGLAGLRQAIQSQLDTLAEVNKHYLRKENQLFPLLEQRGVSGPPKVMWQFHDDIRQMLKDIRAAVEGEDAAKIVELGDRLLSTITDLIYKEENILFPMSLEKLSPEDWGRVRAGEEEIGYALVTPGDQWQPPVGTGAAPAPPDRLAGAIQLDTGELTPDQINLLLTHLPVDLTFVDQEGRVRYYSQGPHRIFPRSPAIIGRRVQDCHPVSSVHVVNRIIDEFVQGTKDWAEFWLEMQGRFIHIRFFPIRDQEGQFRGVVEVTQDVTGIRALQGEKRLLDW